MATIANDTYTIQALRYYFNATGAMVGTFESFLNYYRAQGTFFSGFGAAVRTADQLKVKKAMEGLAKEVSGFPRVDDFWNALAKGVGSLSAAEVAIAAGSGAVDGVKAIGQTALELGKSSLLIYVAIAAVGVFIIPKIPALLKGVKGAR